MIKLNKCNDTLSSRYLAAIGAQNYTRYIIMSLAVTFAFNYVIQIDKIACNIAPDNAFRFIAIHKDFISLCPNVIMVQR